MARPTKYSQEIAEKICKLISAGGGLEESAIQNGISPATFHRWRNSNKSFESLLELAEAKKILRLELIVHKHAEIDPKHALELLGRLKPEKYGRNTRVTNNYDEEALGIISQLLKQC